MNRNNTLVMVILVLILIGGAVYFTTKDSPDSVTYNNTTINPAPEDITNTTTSTTTTTTPPAQTAPTKGVPVVTTNATAIPSDTTAILTGTVIPKGALTSYWYEYGTSDLSKKTLSQTVGSGFVTVQAPGYLTGLAKNTTYSYRLVGENQYGRVSGTQYSFKTTEGTPAPVGSTPRAKSLSATAISRTSANLNGEVTPNRASTGYWFEYGETANLGNTTAFVNAGAGTSAVPVSSTIASLQPLTTYYFRLNAQNQFGTINGAILNFKTAGPANTSTTTPSVATKSATSITGSSARLQGAVNPHGLETTYWFEYSTDSSLASALLTTVPAKSAGALTSDVLVNENISGLTSSTNYYYRVVAQNSLGTVKGGIMTFNTKKN
ncbi:MAG: hypothetical protein M3Q34_02025 [bacterium]|nr:hypothetical protein [bacterium]